MYIGPNATPSSATAQGEIVIGTGYSILGNWGGVTGKGSNTTYIGAIGTLPGIYNTSNSSSWAVISDIRIKKNIEDYN